MATIYLHIGLPKTGTTAIQHFLWDNRPTLERHGVCYPDFGFRYPRVNKRRNAHFLSFYLKGIQNKNYGPAMDRLAELGRDFDRIILTDEVIWKNGTRFPDAWKSLRDDLAARGHSLRIIAYLRRQDSFLLSLYRQRVKGFHTSLPFHDYLDTLQEQYPLDYPAYMDMLSDILGKENLFIRIYEKEQFRGAEHTLYSDFLDIFGLSMNDGFVAEEKNYNEALSDTQLELRRILNMLPEKYTNDPILRNTFSDARRSNLRNESCEKTSFFHPGEQSAYLDSFAGSNRRLAEEYLGRKDGILFYNDTDQELPQYQVRTEALLEETILFYAQAVSRLESEIQELKKPRKYAAFLYRLKTRLLSFFGKFKTPEKDSMTAEIE